jgi:hypothetical protein
MTRRVTKFAAAAGCCCVERVEVRARAVMSR